MRRSQDLPVDAPRRRSSGRGVAIVFGGLISFVLIFGRAIARFYVDYLWHDALDRTDVFWGESGAKATLFLGFLAVFALLAGVNLYIADRTAPETFPANVHPYVERFHEVFGRRLRLVRYGIAAMFALLLATPAIARWQEWLLFRYSQSFGTTDDEFGRDVAATDERYSDHEPKQLAECDTKMPEPLSHASTLRSNLLTYRSVTGDGFVTPKVKH